MMTTEDETFTRSYAFVDPTDPESSPFPASGVWLGFSASDHIGDSMELGYEDPYWALRKASGNTLCVIDFDYSEKRFAFQVIQMTDATDLLFRYARRAALSVTDRWSPSARVIKFLETGDLASISTIWSKDFNVAPDGRKARVTHDVDARRSAKLAVLGALCAYKEYDERNDAVTYFGSAIFSADRSAPKLYAEERFNDFVLQELANVPRP
jgi:hypothetical protein